jgi:hypothetical protein
MKYSFVFLFIILLIFPRNRAFGQNKGDISLNLGISYAFAKKKEFRSNIEFNTGINFKISDYFYLGPKMTSSFLAKDKNYFELGPNISFNFWDFVNQEIIKPNDPKYRNVDMFITSFLGFNLDNNSILNKKLLLTSLNISLDVSSKEIFKNNLYFSYANNFIFNRFEKTINNHKLGLGGVLELKSE